MFRLTIVSALSLIAFIGSSNWTLGQEPDDQQYQKRVRRDRQSLIDQRLNQPNDELDMRAEQAKQEKQAAIKSRLADEIETRVSSVRVMESALKAVQNSDRADAAEDARHLEREIARLKEESAAIYRRFRAGNESVNRNQTDRNNSERNNSDRNNSERDSDRQRQDARRTDQERRDVRENRDGQNQQDPAQQIEHLKAAIPHLHESGMHDIARQLEIRVRESEQRLHADHDRRADRDDDRLHNMLDEMRREIKNLHDEVNQLRWEINRLKNNDQR